MFFPTIPLCLCLTQTQRYCWKKQSLAEVGGLTHNCESDVSKLRHTGYIKYQWTDVRCSNVHAPETCVTIACFWYNNSIINCLLTIFMHNYYGQPIYYTYVSKCYEPLIDWSIPLRSVGLIIPESEGLVSLGIRVMGQSRDDIYWSD